MNLLHQLKAIPGQSSDSVKEQANLIFSSWFSKLEEQLDYIELADREKYYIDADLKECEKYEGTEKIKKCVLEYSLKELLKAASGQ